MNWISYWETYLQRSQSSNCLYFWIWKQKWRQSLGSFYKGQMIWTGSGRGYSVDDELWKGRMELEGEPKSLTSCCYCTDSHSYDRRHDEVLHVCDVVWDSMFCFMSAWSFDRSKFWVDIYWRFLFSQYEHGGGDMKELEKVEPSKTGDMASNPVLVAVKYWNEPAASSWGSDETMESVMWDAINFGLTLYVLWWEMSCDVFTWCAWSWFQLWYSTAVQY